MIYYALMKGRHDGCDYHIGCNMLYVKLKATEPGPAKRELSELIEDHGGIDRDEGWEEIILLGCETEIQRIIPDREWSDEKS